MAELTLSPYLKENNVGKQFMFDRILVPLDGSQTAQCSLPAALGLAAEFKAEVDLVHVLYEAKDDVNTQVDPLQWHMRKAEIETYLSSISQAFSRFNLPTQTHILEGAAAERIIAHAGQREIDLIVMSSHGLSGLSGWNVSSVAQKIMARANRSVMLIRAFQPQTDVSEEVAMRRFQQLLIPLDGSRRAEGVLPIANRLALAYDATVWLLHVAQTKSLGTPFTARAETTSPAPGGNPQTAQYLAAAEAYLDTAAAQLACATETAVVQNDSVIGALDQFALDKGIELTMLSAHGHANSSQPYGSVATSAIMHGATSLFIFQDLASAEIAPTHAEIATRQDANATRASHHAQPAFWNH